MHSAWLPQETLRRKRDGERLAPEELKAIADGLADGSLDDAQAAAFAMAVYFRGMEAEECAQFTWAMRDSGDVFDWAAEDLPGPVLDKHSTGGVGDLVSLPLGPMLAACGAFVPMISGRGLGHTGGTLDKLDAIPGYQVLQGAHKLRAVLREAGVFIVGAGDRLAPADRRLYAIRDVTATVDCVPLITASILSKKLAAGLQGLVLDVKTGNGAVMPALDRSRELAGSLVRVAAQAGLPTAALITDMSQPLGRSAGNALELHESIAMLRGEPADPRLVEVTLALGATLLCLGGLDRDDASARASWPPTISTARWPGSWSAPSARAAGTATTCRPSPWRGTRTCRLRPSCTGERRIRAARGLSRTCRTATCAARSRSCGAPCACAAARRSTWIWGRASLRRRRRRRSCA